ncbi:hypothetical protein HK104_011454 [Borealophlyctis nickersoniae]|nr:hypothetical protein HK104_011454 [Borealophlyctis nickersoniae]
MSTSGNTASEGQATLVLLAVLCVLICLGVIALVVILKKKSVRRDTFLIAGLSDAGKTVLYTRLRYGKVVETRRSMVENEGRFPLSSDDEDSRGPMVHVVDLPGHEKLRFRFADFMPVTRGIAFVIDSTTVARNVRDVAEYLYDVLVNPHVQKLEIPILVVCNKKDMLLALNEEKIRSLLEAEIDRLRTTRAAAVESQDDDRNRADEFLGYENETFKFEHLPNPMSFVPCSLISEDNGDGIHAVKDFIQELAR